MSRINKNSSTMSKATTPTTENNLTEKSTTTEESRVCVMDDTDFVDPQVAADIHAIIPKWKIQDIEEKFSHVCEAIRHAAFMLTQQVLRLLARHDQSLHPITIKNITISYIFYKCVEMLNRHHQIVVCDLDNSAALYHRCYEWQKVCKICCLPFIRDMFPEFDSTCELNEITGYDAYVKYMQMQDFNETSDYLKSATCASSTFNDLESKLEDTTTEIKTLKQSLQKTLTELPPVKTANKTLDKTSLETPVKTVNTLQKLSLPSSPESQSPESQSPEPNEDADFVVDYFSDSDHSDLF